MPYDGLHYGKAGKANSRWDVSCMIGKEVSLVRRVKNMKLNELREELRLHRAGLPRNKSKWTQAEKNGERLVEIEIDKRLTQQ